MTILTLGLGLAACHRVQIPPAQSYKSSTDQWIVRLGLPYIGIWPCRKEDKELRFTPTDECLRMQPARRWRGVWVLGPYAEGEQFCPNSPVPCRWEKRPRFELEWNPRMFKGAPQVRADWGRTYLIEFVGRRTAYQDYNWQGDYTIMVDRLVSVKDVGPAPR